MRVIAIISAQISLNEYNFYWILTQKLREYINVINISAHTFDLIQ